MKSIVISDEFKTKDLKPSSLLKEYFQLIEKELGTVLKKAQSIQGCPACGQKKTVRMFAKYGFNYHQCSSCQSLFTLERPSDEGIMGFYQQSQARKFWNERIYSDTKDQRKTKIIKPRLQWIEDSTQEYLSEATTYCDINSNQPGYFKEIASVSLFTDKTFLNPLVSLSTTDIHVVSKPWWEAKGTWDVVSLFEVLDHTSNVDGLLKMVSSSLSEGGLCFLTSILSSGFDIQTLGENAENIYPPDRLNLFSVEGLKVIFERHGLEILEFSTPGVLDVQMVAKALELNPGLSIPSFVRYLVNRGPNEQRAFQEFLQANLLSSYARVLVRKQK